MFSAVMSLLSYAQERPPVLVELFTSEGCSSCPPAEAFLNELGATNDVVTLAYHVTYWDYLGWKDKFATDWGTDRQKKYARFLKSRTIYTPQMVVDGRYHEVGSKRSQVQQIINLRGRDRNQLKLKIKPGANGSYQLIVDKSALTTRPPSKIDLIAVYFLPPQSTKVLAGENRGRTLRHHNIATAMQKIGRWQGKKDIESYSFTPPEGNHIYGVAVFAQITPIGTVIGSHKYNF